jgi:hypothetical protein
MLKQGEVGWTYNFNRENKNILVENLLESKKMELKIKLSLCLIN